MALAGVESDCLTVERLAFGKLAFADKPRGFHLETLGLRVGNTSRRRCRCDACAGGAEAEFVVEVVATGELG